MKSRTTPLLLAVALFSVFTNLLMLTGPFFMLQVYDRVLASRSQDTLVALFLLVVGLYAMFCVLEFCRGRVMTHVGAKLQEAFSGEVFRFQIMSAALKRARSPGQVSDLDTVRTFFGSPVILALFDLPWTPLFFVAIFLFHPLLGWLALAGGCVLVVAAGLNQILTGRKTAEAAAASGTAQSFAQQADARAEYIRAQGMQRAVVSRYERSQTAALDQSIGATTWTATFSSFSKSSRLFLQSAMLAAGAWLVLRQELTPGAMIAGSILLGRALAPMDMVIGQWQMIQRARRSWTTIRAMLSDDPAPQEPTALPVPEAVLTVANVSVVPQPGEAPILSHVTFDVPAGEAIGIIGRSGSGKSTLARVLTGIITPVMGEVRLGGATLAQYGAAARGRHIGYLPQNVQFFDATIMENIAQLDPEPDPMRVAAAARKAQVHDVILALPDGYETMISAGNEQLSGGQKQRLALARALYNDPVLLVLDEPNSALDTEGSEALNRAVSAMKAERKSVVIMTHRPTAIRNCDKLLVLEGGAVAAFGPRDEVIRSKLMSPKPLAAAAGQGADT